jgi:type II secretory pathway component PulF
MEKPEFRVPTYFEKRTGRIFLFLGTIGAICFLIARFAMDYGQLYEDQKVPLPRITQFVLSAGGAVVEFWWAVGLAAIMVTLLFVVITKSGTIFTVLSILFWLVGAGAYLALWLPSRELSRAAGG